MPILFCDLDGTVVDRAATFVSWAQEFAASHGLGDEAIEQLIAEDGDGMRNRAEFASAVNAQFSVLPELTDVGFMDKFATMYRCIDGVAEALRRAAAAEWDIAIVTNGGRWQMHKIASAGLHALVDTVCVSSLEGVAKPDPLLLRIAAEKLGASIDGSWMIGDSEADVAAACAAGINSVWLHQGRRWVSDSFAPTAESASFADAVNLVLDA